MTFASRVRAGIDVSRLIALEVNAPGRNIKRRTVQTLAAAGGKISITADLVADFIGPRTNVTVNVGPSARPRCSSLVGVT